VNERRKRREGERERKREDGKKGNTQTSGERPCISETAAEFDMPTISCP
jgi:hypothetical protein